jgi:23S rRNA (cytosine1962-C5)-methyltransferase
MSATIIVSARGEQRVRAGHHWIYRTDVVEVQAGGGDVVEVIGPRRRTLGQALYSSKSQIALRLLTRGDVVADLDVIRERLRQAIEYRDRLRLDATAFRLVHADADLLPSLIVDRYGDHLVVQALSQGLDRLLPEVIGMLVEQLAPAGILARNDPRVRDFEGLARTVDVVHGTVPEVVVVREGPVEYEADLRRGQKTGLFLDQRENREAAARYASGRLLDCFSYDGGFGLRLAAACDSVELVDSSDDAVVRAGRNAARNGVVVAARAANVFDELRRLERAGARYDTIVLDPPAFARNKAALEGAVAGYKEINLRAMRLLAPGGYLVTCSCSYHMHSELFSAMLHDASLDSHASMVVVEMRTQGRDHPVLIGVPETSYLKCAILRRLQ